MDVRSLALILYSRSKLEQDIKASKEYKYLNQEFKDTDWTQVIDRFHIQDDSIEEDLRSFITSI